MTLELVNTIASVATTLIVAAAAVAALVQLRHLRAQNQISGQLALRQILLDRDMFEAVGRARQEVPELMKEPAFRRYVADYHLGLAADNERYDSLYEDILVVGRNLENIGNMIRNGLTDARIFVEQYSPLVMIAWDAIEPLLRIRRAATRSDSDWEDFEYLTVLARRWTAEKSSAYPAGVERILPPHSELDRD
ncbi:MAG TPA: hypothetical protein VFO25_10705 [Candidatus Eremiobacteraceae bacterium]|nr:hypothetical protein [Candidatus Eremiobacteraceae bacterium]